MVKVLEDGSTLTDFLREAQETNVKIWKSVTGGRVGMVRVDPEIRKQLRALGYVQ